MLPGFQPCEAHFEGFSLPVFPDHWVSNVVDREQYLSTLHDVLGFEPKVNFNAGVVAAGEAIIESTVTGNAPTTLVADAQVGGWVGGRGARKRACVPACVRACVRCSSAWSVSSVRACVRARAGESNARSIAQVLAVLAISRFLAHFCSVFIAS